MPLPIAINYVAQDGTIRDVGVRTPAKPSGYVPTPEYCPTMKVVRCSVCRGVGIAEFVNGFNLRDGDRLMSGKTIRGVCFRCQRETELIPLLSALMKEGQEGELKHLYRIREALEEAVKRGERIGPQGMVWPLERIRLYERSRERDGQAHV